MTREEERIKQIEQFASQCYEDGERYSAFISGAIWADKNPKNVWHDASEEPQYKNKRILGYSEYFDYFFVDLPSYLMILYGGQTNDWETVVLRNKISKWAYISDLLPKGGEQ